jgi:hypothetical protein
MKDNAPYLVAYNEGFASVREFEKQNDQQRTGSPDSAKPLLYGHEKAPVNQFRGYHQLTNIKTEP